MEFLLYKDVGSTQSPDKEEPVRGIALTLEG